MTKIFRTYKSKHAGNEAKTAMIVDLMPIWRQGLETVKEIQFENLKAGKRIGWIDTKNLPGTLSQRQWKNINNQVNNDLHSWAARMVLAVKPLIYETGLTSEELKNLFKTNKKQEWFINDLLKPIIEELLETNPLPSYQNCNVMLMDGLIAQIEDSRTRTFNKWVRMSTTVGNKPVRIPISHNPYFDAQTGETVLTQVKVTGKKVELSIVKRSEITITPAPVDNVIGIDWGLKNLITTSDGKRYGNKLYAWLLQRDSELIQLEHNLKTNGITKLNTSKRYRKLQQRIRGHVENEIGRIVNQLSRQQLTEIVIEDLDFRGGGLSKKLNRIITRAGRSTLKKRLKDLTEEQQILITTVPAPYSSQECNSCGFAAKTNRRSQSEFKCGHCGLKLNADINASRVIKHRRSMSNLLNLRSKEKILTEIDSVFNARWGIDATVLREQKKRRNSPATPKVTSRSTQIIQSNTIV